MQTEHRKARRAQGSQARAATSGTRHRLRWGELHASLEPGTLDGFDAMGYFPIVNLAELCARIVDEVGDGPVVDPDNRWQLGDIRLTPLFEEAFATAGWSVTEPYCVQAKAAGFDLERLLG